MSATGRLIIAALLAGFLASTGMAQMPASGVAPDGADLRSVWHLGRITGDLERIIHFYHDVVGVDLRGTGDQALAFYSRDTINEFVNAPAHAQFRAAFMPLPGASAATEPANQIYLEAFEYRNIDRRQIIPHLFSPGVSSLRFVVRDLDATLADAKAADAFVITAGAEPIAVPAPAGFTGSARAVMLRDPDGYPVELVEIAPTPQTLAPSTSKVLGAQMTVVVEDVAASLDLYRRLVGPSLTTWENTWQKSTAQSALRNLPETDSRTTSLLLPGSAIVLELIEIRNNEQAPYRPVFQDIGHGHVAFNTADIEAVLDRMRELDMEPLSRGGSWTQISATLRAVYTRDHDGFFIEIIERP